jgi:ComEC/Rec2-related protein
MGNPLYYILFSLISGFFIKTALSSVLIPLIFISLLIFKKRFIIALSVALAVLAGFILSMQTDRVNIPENDYVTDMRVERALRYDYIAGTGNAKMLLRTRVSLFEGDRIYGSFRIKKIKSNTDYEKYLLESGIGYTASPIIIDSVKSTRGVERIRTILINRVKTLYPDDKINGFINSLLWGYRKDLNSDLKKGFLHSGVIHLIAISGQHTTVIFALIMVFLFPFPLPKRIKMLIGMSLIIFYGFLTYLNPPVMRAVLFISIIIFGQMFSRDADNENMLIISMIVMLVLNRRNFYDEGFILSFIAVYGLFMTSRIFSPKHSIYKIFASSMLILLLTFPFMMFRFKYVSIGSPFFTLLLLPFFNLILPLSLLSLIPILSFLCLPVRILYFFIERIILFSEKLPLFFNLNIDAFLFAFLFGIIILTLNKQFKFSAILSFALLIYQAVRI